MKKRTKLIRPIKQETSLNFAKNQRAKMDMQATKIQERNIQRIGNIGIIPFELRSSMEDADKGNNIKNMITSQTITTPLF